MTLSRAKLAGLPVRDDAISEQSKFTLEYFSDRKDRLPKGEGVPVVYDGVGKATHEGSLDCLRRTGMWITFGNASGPVPPIAPLTLMQKGSLIMTRPMLNHYIVTTDELTKMARELFAIVKDGAVKIEVNQRYALKDAASAHRDLAARKTTGSTVLIP